MIDEIKIYDLPDTENHSFYYSFISAEWQDKLMLHRHDAWEIMCILSGRGTRMIGQTLEPFDKGEIVLIPPNIPHSWKFDSTGTANTERMLVSFSHEFLLKCIGLFPELRNRMNEIEYPDYALRLYGAENVRQMMLEMNGESDLKRLSILLRLIPEVFTHSFTACVGSLFRKDRDAQRMQRIYTYVMWNFHKEISLDAVASEVNMGRSSFCIFFKKCYGMSFFKFLIQYRIDMACNMLDHSELSISEICFATGFNDVPHFNRVFKELKGLTPRGYRNLA